MHHFFVDESDLREDGKALVLKGDAHHHASRVLRLKEGEEISVSVRERQGRLYRFGVEETAKDETRCTLRFVQEENTEAATDITLLQCIAKGDKMDFITQKAVELGASCIVPVESGRVIVRLDEKKKKTRRARWQGIADAAAKQSMRGKEPVVGEVMSFAEAVAFVHDADVRLMPYEMADTGDFARTREIIGKIKKGQRVAILIGPEGGFTKEEAAKAVQAGFLTLTMGKRILRTETAGLVMLSFLLYATE